MIVIGVFGSWSEAERGAAQLRSAGISNKNLNVLTPDRTPDRQKEIAEVPSADGHQPGMLKTIGTVTGGAVGLGVGEGLASLLVPGVGPVVAVGLVGGAVLGAVAGRTLGGAAENALAGLPGDEVYVCEDALRQGKAVVIVTASDAKQAAAVRELLNGAGAESVDRARETWWVGLRNAEKEHYEARGGNFERDEANFRSGFAAALELQNRSKSYEQSLSELKKVYPESSNSEAFRQGYERGHEYISTIGKVKEQAASAKR